MSIPASAKPVPSAVVDRLEAELAEILAIYDRLYPERELHLVLSEGSNPVWGDPTVIEGPVTFRPDLLSASYLGRIVRPAPTPHAPVVTVIVAIPRAPNPAEIRNSEAPWQPQRLLKALYRLRPMLYEQIRYQFEMLRLRRAERRDSYARLSFGQGSSLFAAQNTPEQTDARPAILIGFHWLELGGAEKLAFDTVRWALEAGLRVFVVASVPSLQRLSGKLPDHPDVTFLRLDRYLPHHLWPAFVERLIKDENICLIHNHHCSPLYESLPQVRVMAPWVQVIDSTHVVEYQNGGYARISGVWSNYINVHHVISGKLADYFRDRFHASDKVRLGRMLDRRETDSSLPPFNMTAGKKTLRIGFIGRMHYQKRPVVVVETLQALDRWARKNGVEISGTLVGEGAFEPSVAALLKRYGLFDRFEMKPGNTDVPAMLRETDILLLPSNNEGLALVCYEAVEQGCIPISTDVGAQSEIIPPDLLVPLSPHAAVRGTVRAVDRLWRDPAFLARQQQALQTAWSQLGADPTAKEVLMPIYRNAANGKDLTAS